MYQGFSNAGHGTEESPTGDDPSQDPIGFRQAAGDGKGDEVIGRQIQGMAKGGPGQGEKPRRSSRRHQQGGQAIPSSGQNFVSGHHDQQIATREFLRTAHQEKQTC